MAHRGYFVIIRDDQAQGYSDKWAGMECLTDLAQGPGRALEFAMTCDPFTHFWCHLDLEGGYLIDFDERVVISFGNLYTTVPSSEPGQPLVETFYDSPLAFLKHLATNWRGWMLIWDKRGTEVFVEHLRRRNIATIADLYPANSPARQRVTWQA